jgi:hypothetical protein
MIYLEVLSPLDLIVLTAAVDNRARNTVRISEFIPQDSNQISMSSKKSIIYYEKPGDHTDETLQAAKERADELGIKNIVVASTEGTSALKTMDVFKGYNVVVVTHVTGYQGPGIQEVSEERMQKIRAAGGKILIAAHAFSGVNQAIRKKFDTAYPAAIIAQTLRLFSQGMKVVVEITAMAADAGLIPADEDVVAISGSHRGADTAVVIKPANSRDLFDMVVKEIICKPANL